VAFAGLEACDFAGSRVLLIVDRPNISGRPGCPRCLTGDTLRDVVDVSIRELRNHGGEVVDRVARGERVTVTRRGKPVAELRPLRSSSVPIAELMRRRAHLPLVDPGELRRDLDSVIDASL
jgi:prevent-host-death family protein